MIPDYGSMSRGAYGGEARPIARLSPMRRIYPDVHGCEVFKAWLVATETSRSSLPRMRNIGRRENAEWSIASFAVEIDLDARFR